MKLESLVKGGGVGITHKGADLLYGFIRDPQQMLGSIDPGEGSCLFDGAKDPEHQLGKRG